MYTYLDSSNLVACKVQGNDLIIMFRSSTYIYYGAAHEYDNLVNASSAGSYHAQNIKYAYEYEQI